MSRAFSLLHEKVQKYIHKQRWETFRPIQDEAIESVTLEKGNLLICAPTASGKTEAAFLPIVSKLADNYEGSFRAIYISPLKALINDQFRRIDELCADINIPVTKWHGDVGQGIKKSAMENPRGILLITPESLEATWLRRPEIARAMFARLEFVVIDEIHSFVGSERGAQLFSLLQRISAETGTAARKIALSATVGNKEDVARWISGEESFRIIEDESWDEGGGTEGIVKGFLEALPSEESDEEGEGGEARSPSLLSPELVNSIFLDFIDGKNLIFGNSKRKLEEVAFATMELAKARASRTEFLVHHGSLSKETRERAESELKESNSPLSVFCTSTLEMGIDIGKIERVGIIDPPWSVSGFAQRLGRSGRREGASKKFEFLISEKPIQAESRLADLLREDLVKSIAVIQLHLLKFKEPLRSTRAHYSTLVHQILAYCVQKQGARLEDLLAVILKRSFRNMLTEEQFKSLLSHLSIKEILYHAADGTYLPGRIGEKLADHYEFFSVFQSSDQWSLVHDGQLIGQVPVIALYRPGDLLLLGGRVWQVNEVNEAAKRLAVQPAKRAKAPLFSASFGITHPRVHEQMKYIYESDEAYGYLDAKAKELLQEARVNFRAIGSRSDGKIVKVYRGTALQNTLSMGLQLLKIEHGSSECCLELAGAKEWRLHLLELFRPMRNSVDLATCLSRERKMVERFDRFLPDSLLNRGYAEACLDLEGAKDFLHALRPEL